jgi:polyisoprenoid-binding protein YceI
MLIMTRTLLTLIGISLTLGARAETFTVDTGHAEIGFSIKHLMVSNAKGSFNTFEGTLDYDIATKTLNSVQGSIDTASVDTNNEKRDKHLMNEDFFNVVKYPKMTFQSTSVKKTGDNTFDVSGKLNVLSVDHELTLPVTINGPIDGRRGGKLMGIECETTLSRKELGIGKAPAATLGEAVKVSIFVEAVHK